MSVARRYININSSNTQGETHTWVIHKRPETVSPDQDNTNMSQCQKRMVPLQATRSEHTKMYQYIPDKWPRSAEMKYIISLENISSSFQRLSDKTTTNKHKDALNVNVQRCKVPLWIYKKYHHILKNIWYYHNQITVTKICHTTSTRMGHSGQTKISPL